MTVVKAFCETMRARSFTGRKNKSISRVCVCFHEKKALPPPWPTWRCYEAELVKLAGNLPSRVLGKAVHETLCYKAGGMWECWESATECCWPPCTAGLGCGRSHLHYTTTSDQVSILDQEANLPPVGALQHPLLTASVPAGWGKNVKSPDIFSQSSQKGWIWS